MYFNILIRVYSRFYVLAAVEQTFVRHVSKWNCKSMNASVVYFYDDRSKYILSEEENEAIGSTTTAAACFYSLEFSISTFPTTGTVPVGFVFSSRFFFRSRAEDIARGSFPRIRFNLHNGWRDGKVFALQMGREGGEKKKGATRVNKLPSR